MQVKTNKIISTVVVWPQDELFERGIICDPSLIKTDNKGNSTVMLVNCNEHRVKCPQTVGWIERDVVTKEPGIYNVEQP